MTAGPSPPPLPSPPFPSSPVLSSLLRLNTDLKTSGDASTAAHYWKQPSPSVCVSWQCSLSGLAMARYQDDLDVTGMILSPISVSFSVSLQKGSATWRWTPTQLQCPCQTPTPGQQLWTTWGCLPLEWLDSRSCQVQHSPNFTTLTVNFSDYFIFIIFYLQALSFIQKILNLPL